MPELSQLHELSHQVRAPDLDALADLAERRRHRATLVLAAGAVASVVIAGAVAVGLGTDTEAAPDPARPGPEPRQVQRFAALSGEEIRNHPDAVRSGDGDFPPTAARVDARIWTVCLDDCSRETEWLPGEEQSALEVSTDDFATGAVYALDGSGYLAHVVDDWYLAGTAEGLALVDSTGENRAVRFGASLPMEDVTGPLVYSSRGLASVDLPSGTLQPIEGGAGWWWQGAADTWYWGSAVLNPNQAVLRVAVSWRRPDGTFGATVLPIDRSDGGPGMLRAGTPGTMAVVEHFSQPRVAHISTDYGETWTVRLVPDGVDSGGQLPADWPTWPRR